MDINRLKELAGLPTGDKREVTTAGVPDDNVTDKIVSLIKSKTESITHNDLVAFAKKAGVGEDKVLEVVWSLLTALVKGVGKHKDVPDSDFDQDQLKMGVEVEKEHTNNEYVAKIIAKDHLTEIPDYYSRLKQMEKGKVDGSQH